LLKNADVQFVSDIEESAKKESVCFAVQVSMLPPFRLIPKESSVEEFHMVFCGPTGAIVDRAGWVIFGGASVLTRINGSVLFDPGNMDVVA
jgi:hypothetical protein